MLKSQSRNPQTSLKIKLIYNSRAGLKRKLFPNLQTVTLSLEDIKQLLKQYQIPTDYYPTNSSGHATTLAKNAIIEGYKAVIVAGGDGTVGEAANGLIGSEMPLGIIPLGSFMNVAKMLSVPLDPELAVSLIKIGRARKIDVGKIISLGGEKMEQPFYFMESSGIGLEAQFQYYWNQLEEGDWKAGVKILKTFVDWYGHRPRIILDNKKEEIKFWVNMVSISNGPYTGAALPISPKSKLNDHRLTVTLFRMSKLELLKYLFKVARGGKMYHPKIEIFQAKKVKIITSTPRLVHADGRLFGLTPVEFKIVPSALTVITGFPKKQELKTLEKRTYLDP